MPSARSAVAGRGLFGRGASEVCPSIEGRQPEPASSSLAAVRDGVDRGSAAKIGGMDSQTLRDWVHRFNALGLEGLSDDWAEGPPSRLRTNKCPARRRSSSRVLIARRIGVVRWRRIDLKRVIAERFGVDYHERYVGTLLQEARLLAYERAPAVIPPRTPDDRGVSKKTSRSR